MSNFRCVNCKSKKIKNVREIYESVTQIKKITQSSPAYFWFSNDEKFDNYLLNVGGTIIEFQKKIQIENNSKKKLAQRISNFQLTDPSKLFNISSSPIKELQDLEDWQKMNRLKKGIRVLGVWTFISVLLTTQFSYGSIFFLFLVILIAFFLQYVAERQEQANLKFIRSKYQIKNRQDLKDKLRKRIQELRSYITSKSQSQYRDKGRKERQLESIQKSNTQKIIKWSRLYYCYECDCVIDLESKKSDQLENINNFLIKIPDIKTQETSFKTQETSLEQTIVKRYKGREKEAFRKYQLDVALMNAKGYFPISQSYQPGSYGCGAFIIAIILFIFIIGIIIFIYMLIVKPPGTLVVTYELKEKATSPETKTCPQCAEEVKVAARICKFCRYQFPAESSGENNE